ncbi:uncharacterized protein THITE_2121281 [Thermothielavioides terrestris NRRL 8126]|uniref:leucine--tRNA ligase n=2 Tax=Thermothielavioides terrestris TaxID=2587410 RepID=G2RER3_THETT|nr:uncharacterized protein THITE_2121281 [Thermothielavioides terrestris NRRL 8126]AEO70196.1 hypothetical protein THITE_2121281 [Thermothielavioides terrestris NRRL 8126]
MDFAARVARAQRKNTLFPLGFHATGMPIKACADKLAYEMTLFGELFSECPAPDANVDGQQEGPTAPPRPREDVTRFTNVKKGKAALKSAKAKHQFQVMLSLGIPREQIHKFADAGYWLQYFPQLWQQHLTEFGCGIDWRRSFITTHVNSYYDSFVQWQMRRLRDAGKIRFGKRYTVYSPKDAQPCLDHDRATGEGVLVQEYVALKCKVVRWSARASDVLSSCDSIPSDADVFMIAATLRPETMYGQTNLFVSPSLTYGIFRISAKEFYMTTDRAARNLAYQSVFPNWGVIPRVAGVSGSDLLGTLVRAPLSAKGDIYVIPMDSIKESKGTGIVASVPSDSPDDYITTVDLSKKATLHGVEPEWVCLDVLPIINTPEHGNMIAPALVEKLKINSPNDERRLLEAQEIAYKTGFYHGTMAYGPFAGKSVQEGKALVRQQLLDSGDAFTYCEPESPVTSRSGDECVAAFLDQWFLTYGVDEEWRNDTLEHLRGEDGLGFNCFGSVTKHSLEQSLAWMTEWCVTRQYGLGTQLPWDASQLVEGLSDSTIYMAYYTVAHFLHSDMYGKEAGTGNIRASQMTDNVWDYVFALSDDVGSSDIDKSTLDAMRREFTYWYPLDVRVSGKDLVNNHFVFFLYIHQAIWGKQAPQYLPKGIRLNGHLMLNGEKMSKNTGNFLSLDSTIHKFGADATRIALADGSDGIDDANFEETTANAAVLKLFELKRWAEAVICRPRLLGPEETFEQVRAAEKPDDADTIQRTGSMSFWDELFLNELNSLVRDTVRAYDATHYKAALKAGFYDLASARDTYRAWTAAASSSGMHQFCVRRYVGLQALMLAPIAPHWADYIWREVLGKPSTIQTAPFPSPAPPSRSLTLTWAYIKHTLSRLTAACAAQSKRRAKSRAKNDAHAGDATAEQTLILRVATAWPPWQTQYLALARRHFFSSDAGLDIKALTREIDKSELKRAMPFLQQVKKQLKGGAEPAEVFERQLGFDEVAVLNEMAPLMRRMVAGLKEVRIVKVAGADETSAEPGRPAMEFVGCELDGKQAG